MSFYGFNLGKLIDQRKPKKAFSKRTGLFERQLKDELLKEDYDDSYRTDEKITPSKSVMENRNKIYYKTPSERIIEIIIAILIILIVLSILARMDFLAGLF
jgi:hypothetical protein